MSRKVIPAALFLLYGCVLNGSDGKADLGVPADYFRMPVAEQVKRFHNYDLEEQYKLYLYGTQVVHPPATYLARAFAERGGVVVPFLRDKLAAGTDEVTVRDIAAVFSELARSKLYDFSHDQPLVELLGQRARAMRGPWKGTTLRMIDEIRSGK